MWQPCLVKSVHSRFGARYANIARRQVGRKQHGDTSATAVPIAGGLISAEVGWQRKSYTRANALVRRAAEAEGSVCCLLNRHCLLGFLHRGVCVTGEWRSPDARVQALLKATGLLPMRRPGATLKMPWYMGWLSEHVASEQGAAIACCSASLTPEVSMTVHPTDPLAH